MESKHFLDAEGCSSSESGWTMYIASPMHGGELEYSGNDDGDDDGKKNHTPNYNYQNGRDEGSDDSMASDASSGPSHHGKACENGLDSQGLVMAPIKHERGDPVYRCSRWKTGNKQEKKKGGESGSKKEKDLALRRNSASSHTQRGASQVFNA